MKHLNRSQLSSWVKDSQITNLVKDCLKQELHRTLAAHMEVFYTGNPYRTQEEHAKLIGRQELLIRLIDFLEGDFETLFNEDNDWAVIDDEKNRGETPAEQENEEH